MDRQHADWLVAFRIYLAVTAVANLAWEVLQLPLYTIWMSGTGSEQAFAVIHCTGGDLLIALSSLTAALLLAGTPAWPRQGFGLIAGLTIAFGLGYAGLSEWLNVSVRKSWAYSELMPVLPIARRHRPFAAAAMGGGANPGVLVRLACAVRRQSHVNVNLIRFLKHCYD